MSALGDIVMASGLIPALQALYPGAEISWLCQADGAPLLQHNPRITKLIVWQRQDWLALLKAHRYAALWHTVRQFRSSLRREKFDLVLDAQGLLKSGLMTWFTGAPRRISINAREGSHVLMHEVFRPQTHAKPMIGSEYRDLAQHLGAPAGAFQLDLAIGAAAQAHARLARSPNARPLAVLAPFTTRPQKHWFEDRWADLGKRLLDLGFQPVVLGGPADTAEAARMCHQEPGLLNMVGRLKLDESAAMVADAKLLIGVDTGLTHMGSALCVPTLALFGSTAPYLLGPTANTHVMYEALSCSPCHRRPSCDGAFTCMKQLTTQRVFDAAMALMAATSAAETSP